MDAQTVQKCSCCYLKVKSAVQISIPHISISYILYVTLNFENFLSKLHDTDLVL